MEEPEIDLDPARLTARKNVVRLFYKELWDKANLDLIAEIFHEGFTFRGSLGPVLVGYREFGTYVTWLTQALNNYTSDILELIEEGSKVSGKLRFHGNHIGTLFGEQPSKQHVWWYGAPIFTFDGNRVRDLWVLGDIHGLRSRLGMSSAADLKFSPD